MGLAAGVVLAAQSPPPQLPAFRSGIDVVRLDASVLDKDRRPVKDLTAADFTIVEEADVTSRNDPAGLAGMDRDEEARRTREAREMMVASAAGLSSLTQDAALARVPIYGFSIAGLMTPGDVRSGSMLPPELRIPILNARSATVGNDGLMVLAAASGGRAIVDDNEPVRFVPAIFEENSAY